MNSRRFILRATLFLFALAATSVLASSARAQAISPEFVGNFTLISPVHWGNGTLPAGHYTLRIESMRSPIMVSIRNDRNIHVIFAMSLATEDYISGPDALQLTTKNGQPVVQSLVLGELNRVLVFEPSPKHKRVEEAQAEVNAAVLVARK